MADCIGTDCKREGLQAEVERLIESNRSLQAQVELGEAYESRLLAEVERLKRIEELAILWSSYQDDDSVRDQKTNLRLRRDAENATLALMEAVMNCTAPSPGAAHVDCPKCRTRLDPSDAVCFRCERPVDAMDGLARRKPSPKSEAAHK